MDVQYIDDDRADFISSLHMGYFWSLAESYNLVDTVSQNCKSAGLSVGNKKDIPKVTDEVKGRVKRKRGVKNNQVMINEKHSEIVNLCEDMTKRWISSVCANQNENISGLCGRFR